MSERYQRSWVSLLDESGEDLAPTNRAEARSAALLLFLPFQVLWFIVLALKLPVWTSGSLLERDVLLPLGLLAIPLAIGTLLPPAVWLRATKLEPFVMAARRTGSVRPWDLAVTILGAVAIVALLKEVRGPAISPAIIALGHSVLLVRSLASGQPVSPRGGAWRFTSPEWLTSAGGTGDVTEDIAGDFVAGPEVDAKPIYNFDGRKGETYQVGIRIPDDVLRGLRMINVSHNGGLYQQHPEPIVRAQGDPVGSVGVDRLEGLARQLAYVAEHQEWTRLETANRVLEFVQEVIEYKLDEDSTGHLEGGPYEEYGRFALETWVDEVGDCECTAILCTALLSYMGFPTSLVFVTIEGEGGHVAAGVSRDYVLTNADVSSVGMFAVQGDDGKDYLYGETSVDGAMYGFGIIPEDWRGRINFTQAPAVRPSRAS